MGAYLTLLARRFSTYGSNIVYMHHNWLTKILDGCYVGDLPYNLGRGLYFSDRTNQVQLKNAQHLISTYHKGGNHWTLFHVNLATNIVTFVDPKRNDRHLPHPNFLTNWNGFWNRYKRECLNYNGPDELFHLGPDVTHSIQGSDDGMNCGIYTLAVSINQNSKSDFYVWSWQCMTTEV